MKIFFYCFLTFLYSHTLFASPLPQSKQEFCDRFNNTETINTFSDTPDNLIEFKNSGGLFDGGVCWWHSKFQRNLFYLAIFKPDAPLPSSQAIETIIRKIRLGNNVTIIPGFHNVNEFTSKNKEAIQKELEAWQIYDGVVLSRWLDGLAGRTRTFPSLLKKRMNELYHYVEVRKKIAYQKLQIKGITSHAWLVTSVKQKPNGFDLEVIDSNHPRMTQIYSYKIGDDSFFLPNYGHFVPYLEYTREEEKLVHVSRKFCEQSL